MKKIKSLFLFIFLASTCLAQPKGHLVIIGGGDKPMSVMKKIVELAGGENSKILIIPNASSVPFEAYKEEAKEFNEAGCKNISYIFCSREQADLDSNVNKLNGVTGIFFSGGDQSRLTGDLLGTKLIAKVHEIYENGGVISGTSAGAAVMSKVMITGDELINKDTTTSFNSIQKNNVKTIEGFGFVTKCIIDQHFIKRKRNNRLISVVLEHPELLGVAIDESTAILINPDDTFEVLGESQVIIYDPTHVENIEADQNGKFSATGIVMSILTKGQKYNLKNKTVVE